MFAWMVILTVILSIELGFKGTSWLSETIIAPFMVFQMVSLKNVFNEWDSLRTNYLMKS